MSSKKNFSKKLAIMKNKLNKSDKAELLFLIVFIVLFLSLYCLNHSAIALICGTIVLVPLLVTWIMQIKPYIEKDSKKNYNLFVFVLGIFARGVCLTAFMFSMLSYPFSKQLLLVAYILIMIYMILSLVRRANKNALFALFYHIILSFTFI